MSIGEALASMFAGAAGEYAGNRATEIRDEDKARLAEAREMKMMALQQKYQTSEREATQAYGTSEREATQKFSAGESQKDRDFRADQQARSLAAQASEGAKDRASREGIAAEKAGATTKDGKKLKGSPIHLKGDALEGTKDRIVYNYEDGTNEVVNVEDMKGGENYAANEVRPKAMEFGEDVAAIRRNAPEESKKTKAEPAAADQSLYTPAQQSLISKVKAKYPDASEEQIVSSLKANPKTASAFQ